MRNIPGSVPHTSSRALSNAILPYVHTLTNGIAEAVEIRPDLLPGVNVSKGIITNEAVAHGLSIDT